MKPTGIDLYTSGTPNGQKVSIALEELSVPYATHAISLPKNEQKQPSFLKISPNGRIPAIVDHSISSTPQSVFETGAILLYLAARHDPDHKLSFAQDSPDHWDMVQWVMWQQGGLGPMQGQANHFYRYAPTKIPYAIERYHAETRRLYRVLEDRLESQAQEHKVATGRAAYLVGGRFSVADVASFTWVEWAAWAGVDTEGLPRVRAWLDAINQRPAVQRGLDVPEKFELREAMKSKEAMDAYEKMHSSWVMKGQDEEQKKQGKGS